MSSTAHGPGGAGSVKSPKHKLGVAGRTKAPATHGAQTAAQAAAQAGGDTATSTSSSVSSPALGANRKKPDMFACEACSRKKCKCDCKFPVCSRCERTGRPCSFSREGERKESERDYVHFLERRVNTLLSYVAESRKLGPHGRIPFTAMPITFGPTGSSTAVISPTAGAEMTPLTRLQHHLLSSNQIEIRRDLIDNMFRFVGVHSPLLHRNSFLAELDTQSPMLLYSMYAFASTLTPAAILPPSTAKQQKLQQKRAETMAVLEAVGQTVKADTQNTHLQQQQQQTPSSKAKPGETLYEQGTEYYRMSRHVLEDAIETPSVSNLIGIIFLVMFELARSSPAGLYFMGIAVRMAQQLQINQEPPEVAALPSSTADQELRRRVWWTLFELDRRVSFSMGVPFSITEEDIRIGVPTFHYFPDEYLVPVPVDFDPKGYWVRTVLPGEYAFTAMVHPRQRYLKLMSIFGNVVEFLRRNERDADTSDIERSLLGLSLKTWQDSLPAWMRVDTTASPQGGSSVSNGISSNRISLGSIVSPGIGLGMDMRMNMGMGLGMNVGMGVGSLGDQMGDTGSGWNTVGFGSDPFSQDRHRLPWSVCVMHITFHHTRIILHVQTMRRDIETDVFSAHMTDPFLQCVTSAYAIGRLLRHLEHAHLAGFDHLCLGMSIFHSCNVLLLSMSTLWMTDRTELQDLIQLHIRILDTISAWWKPASGYKTQLADHFAEIRSRS